MDFFGRSVLRGHKKSGHLFRVGLASSIGQKEFKPFSLSTSLGLFHRVMLSIQQHNSAAHELVSQLDAISGTDYEALYRWFTLHTKEI